MMTLIAKLANMVNHHTFGGKRVLPFTPLAIKIMNWNIVFTDLTMFTFVIRVMIGESTQCLSKL